MPTPRTIYLLMFDAFGRGGVARSVLCLANQLVERHRVEIVTLYRRREEPRFPIDPRVALTVLRDTRDHEGVLRHQLHKMPTRLRPTPSELEMSLLTDIRLRRKLSRLRPGILISTRPSLHLAAARWAPDHVALIGQDHAPFCIRFNNRRQVAVLHESVPHLDAYTVLTETDRSSYRHEFPGCAERIVTMPNMLPWPVSEVPATLDQKVVVAAGRLSPEKGFSRLLHAFVPVAERCPQWRLRIYGEGEQRSELERLVTDLGLADRVELPGHTSDLRGALTEASVYALSSHHEGFGMSLVEAMSVGVPAVSFDCPTGPSEIIDDGVTGMLVEDGDMPRFSSALRRLIEDEPLRRELGARAWQDASAYAPERLVAAWEELFDRVMLRHDADRLVVRV